MAARNDLHLVIMAGGSGTRFWPKSTARRPKQLLAFGAEKASLLQQTLARFDGLVPAEQRTVVTTQLLGGAIAEQAGPRTAVLAEPQGRNTAPCVYWAAREVARRDPKGILLVMPADHYIPRVEDFKRTVADAAEWARTHDDLVTLGVKPTRPETGYGYLRVGDRVQGDCQRVDAFVEKPGMAKAEEFLASGKYLWNGGMFLWRAEVVLAAFDRHLPEYKRIWDAADGDVARAYPQLAATSVDYGIMEKARNVVTFTLDCGWDDLGSWTSLESVADVLGARREGGVVSAGEVVAVESKGYVVDAPGKLVALLGLDDVIVVETGGAILVARKDRAQDIRLIVEQVKKQRPELA